jgi:hypothetical protein
MTLFLVGVLTLGLVLSALGGCDTTQQFYGDQPVPHVCDDLSGVQDTPVTYLSRDEISDMSMAMYGTRTDHLLGLWRGPAHCEINAGPQGHVYVNDDQPDWGVANTLGHELCHEAVCRDTGSSVWHNAPRRNLRELLGDGF